MPEAQNEIDLSMDAGGLYREELFTDRKVGTIQQLVPVLKSGEPDPAREVIYLGQTQLMTRMGPLPLNFEVKAASLEEAVAGFAEAANQAVQETMQRMEEMRRDAASSLIVPEAGGMPGGPQGGFGGAPGGGKIQMP